MATKRKPSPTKRKSTKTRATANAHKKVSDREFLEILIKFTELGIIGLKTDEKGWLHYQHDRLKKRLKDLK